MANVMMGGLTYTEQYVVEHDGELFGPFESRSDAIDFALSRLELPWTLRALATLPKFKAEP